MLASLLLARKPRDHPDLSSAAAARYGGGLEDFTILNSNQYGKVYIYICHGDLGPGMMDLLRVAPHSWLRDDRNDDSSM